MASLEEKESILNNDLNFTFNKYSTKDYIFFDNLDTILGLCELVKNTLGSLFEETEVESIDFRRVTRADFLEKIRIINNFYHDLKIDFDVNAVVNNGIFVVKTNSIENTQSNLSLLYSGHSIGTKSRGYIDVNNNDILMDSIVWVHELTHYRNADDYEEETVERSFLTEVLSFAYQYIYMDYLDKIGYTYDALTFKLIDTRSLYKNACDCINIIKIYKTYDLLGEVSKENYSRLYNEEEYENVVDNFYTCHNGQTTINKIRYALAIALSTYMYIEYKKDHKFLKRIELLNNNINEISFKECLRIVNIINYNEEGITDKHNIDKILSSILVLKEELSKDRERIKEEDKELIK